jgi:hypothetical protein
LTAGRDAALSRPRLPHAVGVWLILLAMIPHLAACDDDPTGTDLTCLQAPALTPGETVEGALSRGDAVFLRAYIDYYAVDLADSATLEATLTSDRFDPFLYRLGPGRRVTHQAFDTIGAPPGEPETAILRARVGPGCHLLGASSWTPAATGAYVLRVDTIPHDPDTDED